MSGRLPDALDKALLYGFPYRVGDAVADLVEGLAVGARAAFARPLLRKLA